MILLTKGQTAESIYVTLNEKRTLDSGYYLFVFTHQTTQDVITKIYNFDEDESSYPSRYNKFPINTSTVFSTANTGFWKYHIYEQESSSNTNVTGLTEVECGIMRLDAATEFTMTEYESGTTYRQYTG